MSIKTITLNEEARNKVKRGVDALANAVGVTLGPKGRNVIIEKEFGQPISTKDGVTVAKEIDLADPVENAGAQLVKEAANRTGNQAGDGTTTSTVLAQAIFTEGLKHLDEGSNPVEMKRGMDKAVNALIDSLEQISQDVTTNDQIKSIGTISANNDTEIGTLIATAMEKVGKDGVITVSESNTGETSLEIVEGMQFERGYISPYFATDQSTMEVVLDEPVILLFDKKISSVKDILPILDAVSKASKSILIVCEDVTDEALAAMVVNKVRGLLKVAAVKAPDFGDRRIQTMEDLAVLTGGTFISETKAMKLDKTTMAMLGQAKTVTITKGKTTIIGGMGTKEAIETRIEEIKKQLDAAKSDYDREKLQERLGKLAGGVAILNIGAATEVEMKEKKDRVDDALHATKAAVEEGVVPGGGMALILALNNLGKKLDSLGENEEQRKGIQIIKKVCTTPFDLIMKNAGLTPEVILERIKQNETVDPKHIGYDVRNAKLVDMFKEGIIDPTKVTRTALENAVSVAGVLLTTEAVITKVPEEKKQVNPMMEY